MEQQLSIGLQGLTAGFDSASDHVVITDRQGKILYANKSAERHTGYSIAEMIGRKPGELWGGLMSPEFYQEMWDSIAVQKSAYVCELQNHTKEGKKYWQEVHILPVLNAEGESEFFIGIELDLDEENRRQALIQEYHKQALTVEKAVQVRWPLGWLLEAGNLSPKQMEELQKQYSSETSLEHLVEDLLALSNVVFANQQKNEQFCAIELLQEVIHDIQERYPDSAIDFKHDGLSKALMSENKKLLREAVSRLITNAVEYSPPTAGDVVLTLIKTNTLCVIKCEDNGIGIAFHEQKQMMKKFFRGTRARKMNPGGSGLGLYLAKSIADVRGWTISCISEPYKGTMFKLDIPLQRSEQTLKPQLVTANG